MLRIVIQEKDGEKKEHAFDKMKLIIGRLPSNDIHLPKNNVSKRHAKITWLNGRWELRDLRSTNGTYVNGERIQARTLQKEDQIIIGDFMLQFEELQQPPQSLSAQFENEVQELQVPQPIHQEQPYPSPNDLPPDDFDNLLNVQHEQNIRHTPSNEPQVNIAHGFSHNPSVALPSSSEYQTVPIPTPHLPEAFSKHPNDSSVNAPSVEQMENLANSPPTNEELPSPPSVIEPLPGPVTSEDLDAVKEDMAISFPDALQVGESSEKEVEGISPIKEAQTFSPLTLEDPPELASLPEELRKRMSAVHKIHTHLKEQHPALFRSPFRQEAKARKSLRKDANHTLLRLFQEGFITEQQKNDETLYLDAVNEALGWGPLDKLLKQEDVESIMVYGFSHIYTKKNGRSSKAMSAFSSERALLETLERMVAPCGIRMEHCKGLVEARLPNGAWLHAFLPPITSKGISIFLQPAPQKQNSLSQLLEQGWFNPSIHKFLLELLRERKNILFVGSSQRHKDLLYHALAEALPSEERIVSIENKPFFVPAHPQWVSLQTRPPDLQGQGEISKQALLQQALRIHPQRLLLDELEGPELFQLLGPMLMGFDGVWLSTRTQELSHLLRQIGRLEQHLSTPLLPQFCESFDIAIQVDHLTDGLPRVTSIDALSYNQETPHQKQLFRFQKEANEGEEEKTEVFLDLREQSSHHIGE